MIVDSNDFANDSLGSLAKPYLQRVKNTERLRKQYEEYAQLYKNSKDIDQEIEKILANRIKDYCVIGPNGEILTASKPMGYVNYTDIVIKQAVK